MNIALRIAGVALSAAMFVGCTSVAGGPPAAPGTQVKETCDKVAALLKENLQGEPTSDSLNATAGKLGTLLQGADADSKALFIPVENALRQYAQATPGESTQKATEAILSSMQTASVKCAAAGSTGFTG